jgi:hypothetical protein
MRLALLNLLQGDATLVALLPGGIYDGAEVDHISRTNTPDAFDSDSELLPCAIVKLTGDQPFGPFRYSSQRNFTIYLYQRTGSATIEQARDRCITLLHRQRLSGVRAWQMFHANDLLGQWDAALDCPLIVSRYRLPLHLEPTIGLSGLLTESGAPILAESGELIYVEN